ncbi:MAG: rod shape-determining protein MreD [Bacteroidetes bacterium]|nr:MAG: rod shape-determining protein MreD [Bacteroidota bacterium]
MNKEIIINIIRFILLVLLQVLILNNINLGGYLNPYVYVMFILLLPFETPKYLLLISAFAIGFSIDLFTGSMGMHAAASTFMAFMRPTVSRMIHSRKEYEPGIKPGINDLGIQWFISYTLLLVFAHHFVLFFIEAFRFDEFFSTLSRIVLSTLLSTLIIIILDLLVKKDKK